MAISCLLAGWSTSLQPHVRATSFRCRCPVLCGCRCWNSQADSMLMRRVMQGGGHLGRRGVRSKQNMSQESKRASTHGVAGKQVMGQKAFNNGDLRSMCAGHCSMGIAHDSQVWLVGPWRVASCTQAPRPAAASLEQGGGSCEKAPVCSEQLLAPALAAVACQGAQAQGLQGGQGGAAVSMTGRRRAARTELHAANCASGVLKRQHCRNRTTDGCTPALPRWLHSQPHSLGRTNPRGTTQRAQRKGAPRPPAALRVQPQPASHTHHPGNHPAPPLQKGAPRPPAA